MERAQYQMTILLLLLLTGGLYIFGDQRFMSFQRGQLNWVNSYYLWEHIQQAGLILKIAIMADHITGTVRYGRNQPT